MIIILTHIGTLPIPEYLEVNVKQIRRFNKDVDIYLLINKSNQQQANLLLSGFDVKFLFKENYENDKISNIERLVGYGKNNFWTVSTTRLFYLEECMKKENFEDVIHFENDVLLYTDINDIKDGILNNFNHLAITPGGFDRCMTGFLFIKNYRALQDMTDYWIDLLSRMSHRNIIHKYKVDMVNEMSLLYIYSQDYDYLEFFPILPVGKYSKHLDDFNSLFDPASYGQFVGGTPKVSGGAPPGFLDKNHFIGNEIINNRNDYDLVWENNIPYLKYLDKIYKINNLHIHSKELYKFIKKD